MYDDPGKVNQPPLFVSQRIVQVCLFLVAAVAITDGILQMYLGEPEASPRLDNIHRFMAGLYFSLGLISLWAAVTIRQQKTLVYLLAISVLSGGIGRLVSIYHIGLPEPAGLWIAYLVPELIIPFIMVGAQVVTNEKSLIDKN